MLQPQRFLEKKALSSHITIKVESEKGIMHHLSGRKAQALLALMAEGVRGLSHITFQAKYNGGYRLAAYVHELAKGSLIKIDSDYHAGRNTRYKKYTLSEKLKLVSYKKGV